MFKHIILIIVFSVACIFFKTQAAMVIHELSIMHDHLLSYLSLIFSNDTAGNMLKNVFALMLVPLVVGLMIACLFWLVKRSPKTPFNCCYMGSVDDNASDSFNSCSCLIHMQEYLQFLKTILDHGIEKKDRTSTGTVSIFSYEMRFDLQKGFPLVTTKKLHTRSIVHELLWFLRGDTNIQYLNQNKVTIWDEWADSNGNLGPVYGKQWRAWETSDGNKIDQISNLIHEIKNNPDSRRLIVSAWNVGDLAKMALPPCHLLFQFYIVENKLSCKLTQRSADAFLGVPFNIASYSLFTHMIAQQCDLEVGEFIWSGGDCHIYLNHMDQVREQLTRKPKSLPQLLIHKKPNSIFEYEFSDFEFLNYDPHPAIKAAVAV